MTIREFNDVGASDDMGVVGAGYHGNQIMTRRQYNIYLCFIDPLIGTAFSSTENLRFTIYNLHPITNYTSISKTFEELLCTL